MLPSRAKRGEVGGGLGLVVGQSPHKPLAARATSWLRIASMPSAICGVPRECPDLTFFCQDPVLHPIPCPRAASELGSDAAHGCTAPDPAVAVAYDEAPS